MRTSLWNSLAILLIVSSGCASLDLGLTGKIPGMKPKFPEPDAKHPVSECLCLWEAAEGRGLNNLPARGFAGQVLFFASGKPEPVKVNGDVRVYLFDDQGDQAQQSQPIHQFDFPAEAWNTYLRDSNVGASYQIFIPYTRPGWHEANCSIRIRYTDTSGVPVYSKMAMVPLAGTKKQSEEAQATAAPLNKTPRSAIQQMSHEEPAPVAKESSLRTMDLTAMRPASADPSAARLQKFERMMEDFLAEQAANSPTPAPEAPATAPPIKRRLVQKHPLEETTPHPLEDTAHQPATAAPSASLSRHPLEEE